MKQKNKKNSCLVWHKAASIGNWFNWDFPGLSPPRWVSSLFHCSTCSRTSLFRLLVCPNQTSIFSSSPIPPLPAFLPTQGCWQNCFCTAHLFPSASSPPSFLSTSPPIILLSFSPLLSRHTSVNIHPVSKLHAHTVKIV